MSARNRPFPARRGRLLQFLAAAVVFLAAAADPAHACLTGQYERLSAHCVAEPFYERILKVVFGDLAEPRQIAVIAGVSEYPNLSALQQLPPVDHDIEMLTTMTAEQLKFDEVIVLKNEDFNSANLRYVFRVYLPDVLVDNPKSRVLFAFSGHGANLGESGYLFLSSTTTISPQRHADVDNAIGLDELAGFLGPTVDQAQHFLALINACKGGGFLSFAHAFGEDDATGLQEPGAQAITAGGANDLVHAYESLGEGSVFFEMVEQALSGRSIRLGEEQFDDPSRGEGILTATDLADYLIDTISVIEDHRQSPRFGSLTGHERGRQGQFFFILDEEQARETLARDFPEGSERVFGTAADSASSPAVDDVDEITSPETETPARSPADMVAATDDEADPSPAPDTTTDMSSPEMSAAVDLLTRLGKAGLDHSVSQSEILGWLANPSAMYAQFGEGLIELLDARRPRHPVHIDVAFWFYEDAGGRVDKIAPDGALDPGLASAALVRAYNSRYGTSAASLDAILAP
jgi:hypothetical protein